LQNVPQSKTSDIECRPPRSFTKPACEEHLAIAHNQYSRAGHCTFDPLLKVFAWSMGILKGGAPPSCRHDGSEFTPQDQRARTALCVLLPRAALLQVRGDWEWLCQCFRFRHYANESFCWLCDATHTGPTSYLNVSQDAPYRQTKITHERFEYQANTQTPPPDPGKTNLARHFAC
jgi:hypothetical protein